MRPRRCSASCSKRSEGSCLLPGFSECQASPSAAISNLASFRFSVYNGWDSNAPGKSAQAIESQAREVARACGHGVNGIYNEVTMKTVEVVAAIIKDDKTAGEKPVVLATRRG